jgi:hypothetical protein
MQVTDEVAWSAADFVVAGLLLAAVGAAVELAIAKAGSRLVSAALAALGVAAAVVGEADDAPGLVLLGIVLVACACAVAIRTRSVRVEP